MANSKEKVKAELALEDLEEALEATLGLKCEAARRLGCSVSTVNSWIKSFPELEDLIAEAHERILDAAESSLFEAVREGKRWAVEYVLRNKGRSRGYTEGREALPPTQPIHFHYEVHQPLAAKETKAIEGEVVEDTNG